MIAAGASDVTRGCESRLRRYHHSCPADEAPDLISDLPAEGCAPPRRSPSARPGPPEREPNPARRRSMAAWLDFLRDLTGGHSLGTWLLRPPPATPDGARPAPRGTPPRPSA
jgi:hypothetical protein